MAEVIVMSAKHLPNLALLDALNGRRHWLSALGTAVVGLAIILAGRPNFTKPSPLPAQRAMELVLETAF